MKNFLIAIAVAMISVAAAAQVVDPVQFSSQVKVSDDGTGELLFEGTIANGWHVYSTNLNDAGPIEAELTVNSIDGMELVGPLKPRGKVIEQFEEMFGAVVKYFEHRATFVQKVKFTKPSY